MILENMKSRIAEATKQYLKTCDKKGFPMSKNISEKEEKGIKEMKEDKENVILCTDKSGKLAAQKRDLYVEAMKPHLTGDASLTWQDQCNAEKKDDRTHTAVGETFETWS